MTSVVHYMLCGAASLPRTRVGVGHGAECMVGQEARAGPGATATVISSVGSGPAKT
jgi:hypothetical protein